MAFPGSPSCALGYCLLPRTSIWASHVKYCRVLELVAFTGARSANRRHVGGNPHQIDGMVCRTTEFCCETSRTALGSRGCQLEIQRLIASRFKQRSTQQVTKPGSTGQFRFTMMNMRCSLDVLRCPEFQLFIELIWLRKPVHAIVFKVRVSHVSMQLTRSLHVARMPTNMRRKFSQLLSMQRHMRGRFSLLFWL